MEGVGPRTLPQSLALVSEVIHSTPSVLKTCRFRLPYGGKDGHPFPVPIKVMYDTAYPYAANSRCKVRIGEQDKQAIHRIYADCRTCRKNFVAAWFC